MPKTKSLTANVNITVFRTVVSAVNTGRWKNRQEFVLEAIYDKLNREMIPFVDPEME